MYVTAQVVNGYSNGKLKMRTNFAKDNGWIDMKRFINGVRKLPSNKTKPRNKREMK